MKVAINTAALQGGHKLRGIGVYSLNLLENLKKLNDLEIQEFNNLSEVNSADLVHYLNFDFFLRTLPFNKRYPSVVTIHDITPLLFSKHYPKGLKGTINLKLQQLSLSNIQAIITDSESSKRDIINKFGIKKGKVYVVYLACSKDFKKITNKKLLNKVANRYKLPEMFALYTGNNNWNKNILNLTEAAVRLNLDIYFVGKGFEDRTNLNHPEKRSFKQFLDKYSNNKKVHILGFISSEDLVAIYNLATVALLPSFYEGFGLPILEAQSTGTPVITSNLSSMPEVAGDSAVLVNPYDVNSISQGIFKLISNDKFRDKIINKGYKNVKRFSWEKTAQETYEVYKDVLS